jgi:hypothetical protein
MFRVVINARLSAALLFALRRVNRSACAASRIRDSRGGRGGGRLGDNLIFSSFFKSLTLSKTTISREKSRKI